MFFPFHFDYRRISMTIKRVNLLKLFKIKSGLYGVNEIKNEYIYYTVLHLVIRIVPYII